MLNVGGADYDEMVERGWWLERWGGRNLEQMVIECEPKIRTHLLHHVPNDSD